MSSNGEEAAAVQPCEACGEYHARLVTERVEFEYGERGAGVMLHADLPMWVCDACGEHYTAQGAEEAERAAVCAHLGRLTPREIVRIRALAQLTQEAFAHKLGVGRVTLARWETGQQLQSAVYDKLVRDLAKELEAPKPDRVYQYRTDVSGRYAAARDFVLIAAAA
jgi:putative zinc finger/helix-turn-helix YgiT family protein